MNHRRAAVAFLLAATQVLLLASPAGPVCWAQGPGDDATTAMARARFKEGVEYFDKGQFDLARAAFLQAYALKKHPAVLLNLAWSCLKGGHVLEGERYFRQILAAGVDLSDKQRADATDGLAQALAKLGRIDVMGAPPGTDVTVDGELAGTTPLSDPVLVEAGAHTVKMRAPDGSVETESVTTSAGERAVARFARAAGPLPAGPASSPAASPAGPNASATSEPAPARASEAQSARANGSAAPANVSEGEQKPSSAPPQAEGEGNMSIVPLVVGGVLVAAGATVAIVMKIEKDTAQQNANGVASGISNYEAALGISPPRCTSSASMPLPSAAASACQVWNNDNTIVNEDATVANVAIGIGAAALVGTSVYAILYATHSRREASRVLVTPLVGPAVRGLSFGMAF